MLIFTDMTSMCESKRKANGIVQRTLNNSAELLIPMERIEKFMYDHEIVIRRKDGKLIPWQRNSMADLTDIEIVDTYNSQTRGICNYYSIASIFSKLMYFVYLVEYSCLKTLVKKHKTRISGIKRMFRCRKSWSILYETKEEKNAWWLWNTQISNRGLFLMSQTLIQWKTIFILTQKILLKQGRSLVNVNYAAREVMA